MAFIIRKTLRISTATYLLSLMLLATCLLLCHHKASGSPFQLDTPRFWGRGSAPQKLSSLSSSSSSSEALLLLLRGGSEAPADASVDESDADTDEEEEEEEEASSGKDKSAGSAQAPPSTSMAPVNILFKTNVGNQVFDQSIEVSAARTRDIASLKKTLSRQLPGKPPVEQIRLMQHGKILKEEIVLDELLDDEDDEDEEEMDDGDDDEENKPTLTLVLDMVPPVDPRFHSYLDDRMNDMTTSDLLEAYTLNEAAIWMSSHYWAEKINAQDEDGVDEDSDDERDESVNPISTNEDAPLIGFQLKQYANSLRSQLEDAILTNKTASLLEDPVPPAKAARERSGKTQIRGQRIRPGTSADGSGPSSSVVGLKQNVQHYLNINWGDTIRNFCLFLFFGYFGGKTVASRAVLLLGAPLCFIIQARPVKLFLKEVVYIMLRNPPSIVLSLLPAPQQACLSLSNADAMQLIYGQDAPGESMLSHSSEVLLEEDEMEVEGSEDDDDDEDESEEIVLSDDDSSSDEDD